MKTKNIILFFLTLILGFVLTHCSTYTVKKDMSIKGELTKTPKWYVKYDREDKKWMYETSVSVSPDLELAVKKSVLLAKAKLADKIEDPQYQQENSDNIKIDYLYYLNLASNPLDQALEVAYNIKNFVHEQYKLRVIKYKLLEEFKNLYKTTLIFN